MTCIRTLWYGLALGLSIGIAATSIANPRSDYLLHCGGCHLENGAGVPPDVPDLRVDLDWIALSAEGRSYLMRVPGASQVPLSDARLAEVLNWIMQTYYPDKNNILPFSEAEVSSQRRLLLNDPLRARRALTNTFAGIGQP
ncbi:MAG: hypothetical protein AAF098_15790 [Pseudomonadota bacterium]